MTSALLERALKALGRPAWEVTTNDVDRVVDDLAVAGPPGTARPRSRFGAPCDGVMRTARQLGGIPQQHRQVVSLQNVHDLLGRLHSSPPRELAEVGIGTTQPRPGGDPTRGTGRERSKRVGQIQWPPPGSFHARQRAAIWPSIGQFLAAVVTEARLDRRHGISTSIGRRYSSHPQSAAMRHVSPRALRREVAHREGWKQPWRSTLLRPDRVPYPSRSQSVPGMSMTYAGRLAIWRRGCPQTVG